MSEITAKLSPYSDYLIFGAILFFLVFKNSIAASFYDITNVSVSELSEALKQKETVLVDVRTEGEYVQGHVKESVNIPLHMISEKTLESQGIKNGQKVYLICRSGNRSMSAAIQMKKMGYDVVNVKGGMTYWQMNKLPVAY